MEMRDVKEAKSITEAMAYAGVGTGLVYPAMEVGLVRRSLDEGGIYSTVRK